jgi:hypothetical protein
MRGRANESLSIILQRRAIAYWWRRIQYRNGSYPVWAMSLTGFFHPRARIFAVPAAGKRRERPDSAALLDKSTSVADGEGAVKAR